MIMATAPRQNRFTRMKFPKNRNTSRGALDAWSERAIGKYEDLDHLVGKPTTDIAGKRAGAMNTRPIFLQTVVGNAKVARNLFFAINSQGTPLDETETYLI